MKRLNYAVVLAMALVGGLLAAPAAADTSGVGVITGAIADVGSNFKDGHPCTKTSPGMVEGSGITVPTGLNTTDKKFSLTHPGASATVPPTFVVADSDGDVSNALLNICGNVTKVGGNNGAPGIGPWCGMSKGYNGTGQLKLTTINTPIKVKWLNLWEIGWKASAGTVLPLTGKSQEAGEGATKGAKSKKFAQILGAVSARSLPVAGLGPGAAGSCTDTAGSGGVKFFVDGVIAIVNRGGKKDTVVRPNTLPGTCKDTDNLTCLYPDKPKTPPAAKGA